MVSPYSPETQFDQARWRVAVLAPCWALQIATGLGLVGLFSFRLAETVETYDRDDKAGMFPMVEVVWECVNIALSAVSVGMTISEVVKMVDETLTPWLMLATHVLKTTCASAILALDVVVFTERKDGNYPIIGLGIDGLFILACVVPLVYSIMTFRHVAHYDKYHQPAGVKPYRSAAEGWWPPRGMPDPIAEPGAADSQPYGHERSTKFEAYRTRRTSGHRQGSLAGPNEIRETVDRAVGSGFGWLTSDTDRPVSSGIVPSARPREHSIPSITTTTGTTGGSATAPGRPRSGTWQSQHASVSGPEPAAHEDEHGVSPVESEAPSTVMIPDGVPGGARRAPEASTEALLGYDEVTFDFRGVPGVERR